jgi:hypothetical protein
MGRPAKKRSYWEAKKRRAGELQAEREALRQNIKKDLPNYILTKLDRLTDRIDPLEFAAVLGMTYVVKQVIDTSEEMIVRARAKGAWIKKQQASGVYTLWSILAGPIITYLMVPEETDDPETKALKAEFQSPSAEALEWFTAFALSYIIVHNAGQLIGLLEGGIAKIVPMLLGVTVA